MAVIALATALAGQGSGQAVGQDAVPLRGDVMIAGPQLVDPAPEDPRSSHAYVTVTGAAAIRLYRSMTARAEDDICLGDGRKLKRAGGLACSIARSGRDARCDFSLDLRQGTLAGGKPC